MFTQAGFSIVVSFVVQIVLFVVAILSVWALALGIRTLTLVNRRLSARREDGFTPSE